MTSLVSGRILLWMGSSSSMSKARSLTTSLLRNAALSAAVSSSVTLAVMASVVSAAASFGASPFANVSKVLEVTISMESKSSSSSSLLRSLSRCKVSLPAFCVDEMRKELTTAVVRFMATSPNSSPNKALMTVVLPTDTYPITATRISNMVVVVVVVAVFFGCESIVWYLVLTKMYGSKSSMHRMENSGTEGRAKVSVEGTKSSFSFVVSLAA
mmetsp:Transcript_6345/g.9641  ORF Transcript_6345/g.9641 Transcript_6345/m.9641 type:complete len:213 (-) Transcript_6345:17-655(-)